RDWSSDVCSSDLLGRRHNYRAFWHNSTSSKISGNNSCIGTSKTFSNNLIGLKVFGQFLPCSHLAIVCWLTATILARSDCLRSFLTLAAFKTNIFLLMILTSLL